MDQQPTLDELFERRMTYPDFEPQERLARLVGLDEYKSRLTKMLAVLVNPAGLEVWAKKHHAKANGLLNLPDLFLQGRGMRRREVGPPAQRVAGSDFFIDAIDPVGLFVEAVVG